MHSRAVARAALSLGLSGCTLQALAIGAGLFQSLVAFALIALTRSTASRIVGGAFRRKLIEGPTALGIHCVLAGEGLPTTNGDVDMARFDLHCVGAPTDPLGRHDRRPRA